VLRRLFALVVLLALLAAGLYYLKLLPAGFVPKDLGFFGQRLQEARLTTAVKAALRLNRLTTDGRIDVSSEEGVVTLRGEVGSGAAAEAAARVAGAVPDVKQVVSHVKVVASPPPPGVEGRSLGENLDDHALEVGVRLALSLRRDLGGSDIEVRAFRRQVTLSGEVGSDAARQVAVQTARETAGVTGVKDDLRLGGSPSPSSLPEGGPDVAAVRSALRANPSVGEYGIEVALEEGRVVLRGRVRTKAEKELAGLVARDAARGPVENALQIHP
jgi:osmotically-inducible protein OsmY